MGKLENPIAMAVIGAPHGIRGEVRVKTFTGDPLGLGAYGPLSSADGRRFTVAAIRPAKNVMVVRFKEISSREGAEAVTGTELYVDRAALPDDLEEDEFYHADLVGLAARDVAGDAIGSVNAVHNFGGGDMVEIRLAAGTTVMVPFTLAAIPEISIANGFIVVDPAAAGLLNDDDSEPAERDREDDRQ